MATTNYNDERLTAVKSEEQDALTKNEQLYDGMSKDVVDKYQQLADRAEAYGKEQAKLQQDKSDLALEKLEQDKAYAKKDYTKEQSGAYVDWQKQSNQYGANAEKKAAQGLTNTGYSESSQVSMYNTYQNRIAIARDAFVRTQTAFDTAMAEAKLQNSSILAEIAFKAMQEANQYIVQGLLYKDKLLGEKADRELQIKTLYNTKYQGVLAQINAEQELALEREKAEAARKYQEAQIQLARDQFNYQKQKDAEEEKARIAKANATAAAKRASSSQGSVGSKSRESYVKKVTKDEKRHESKVSASEYLNQLIASGASKDKVANEIALALRNGAISKTEAAELRKTFTPRGIQY